jgi:hypothetical protein
MSEQTGAAVIPADLIEETIEAFTALDASGDKRSMNKMARRLGKEQPALLQFAVAKKEGRGDEVGEAAVFYGTLIWAMFDRHQDRPVPRLTPDNLEAAERVVEEARGEVEGLDAKPLHERTAPALVERQPHLYAKLAELIAEDVREAALTEECAEVIFPTAQVVVEAFDAAATGRRPGERQGPVVRETPKVGRNEPCPCGSGKKYKKCCGRA